MSKSVVLTEAQWLKIYNQIAKEYPPSVLLVRNKMKSILGFTSRTHEEWEPMDNNYYSYRIITIHLDFYSEPKRTMFLLKYSEIIGKTSLDLQ
jgi:hypothetical protein